MHPALLLALAPTILVAQAASPDPFAPVRFLQGVWQGTGTGAPGSAAGTFSFDFQLDGKALLRHNATVVTPGKGPAAAHDDLMVIFPEGGALRALYLDNEGHVIHYTGTPLAKGIAFLSEPGPGPRFRLTYLATAPDTVTTTFELAFPNQPETFTKYLEGSSRKVSAGSTPPGH